MGQVSWEVAHTKIPYFLFSLVFGVTVVLTFLRNYSLIPVMGFLCCAYLLSESGQTNWERFLVWLVIGMVLYFSYGSSHSKLKRAEEQG
jgi:hypothetical protein